MTFVDHFLNFVIYGCLFTLCVFAIAGVHWSVMKGRERRRTRAAERRGEVDAYPKKTSASA